MHLSRHFTLAELTRSETAAREGIANQPGSAEIESLRALCASVLDPLREAVGRPIRVNSGYRGPALNRRIGGAATSQHSKGMAADIQAPGMAVLELFKTVIRLGLPFDQIIYEAQSATTKWVHVSHAAGACRGEIRVAEFGPDGRPRAYPRITAQQALELAERVTRSGRGTAQPRHLELADEPPDEARAAPAEAVAAAPRRARRVAPPAAKKAPTKKTAAPRPRADARRPKPAAPKRPPRAAAKTGASG